MTSGSRSLVEWLDHAGSVHRVDLGLERVGRVAERMGFRPPGHAPAPRSVIVAGTNGKGSTCIALEALLLGAGLSVGTTLSPHLHVFNERVRVNGSLADDDTLCSAFAVVEAARGGIPLTYFEFSALVALHCFRAAAVDVAILEVGLGGRLDAFNLVDADVAIVTSIGLDHQEYLGDDLEGIGREKAAVMRPGRRVVLGADVTRSVVDAARALGCEQARLGADFHVVERDGRWSFQGTRGSVGDLPVAALAPENCALALEAAAHLTPLPADPGGVLGRAELPGRMETWRVADGRPLVLDVAHNPAGACFLAGRLTRCCPDRRFVAVLGMLKDKDAAGVAAALAGHVRCWICVPTRGIRGQPAARLAERLADPTVAAPAAVPVVVAGDAAQGLARALSAALPGDGILAFGSFDLVEQMRDLLLAGRAGAEVRQADGPRTECDR